MLFDHRAFTERVPFYDGVHEACGFRWDENDICRFLHKTEVVPHPTDPNRRCVLFTGAKSRGRGNTAWYGTFWTKGKHVRAHKFSAVAILGLRPAKGHDHLDHECKVSRCVCCIRVLPQLENLKRRWGNSTYE